MIKTKVFSLCLLCCLVLNVCGCASSGRNRRSRDDRYEVEYSESSMPEEKKDINIDPSNLKFEDIPIPKNFKIDIDDSFVFKNDFLRVGIVRYSSKGKGDITTVTNFFKKQMPMYDWEIISSIEYFKSILTFSKDDQSSVVIIEPVGGKIAFTIASAPQNRAFGAEAV